MRKYLYLVTLFSAYNLAVLAQTSSQTRTANLFNSITEAFQNNWSQATVQNFSADDNSFAVSKKLAPKHGFLLLLLRDFRFDIPADATIENITVAARRFKTGTGNVTDYFAYLITEPVNNGFGTPYGVRWTNSANYPNAEAEVFYTQNGTGNNGGASGNQFYQWTPAIINSAAFGVRIDNYAPTGGSVVIYYDLVQITVQYSLAAKNAVKTSETQETKILKEPIVYPNPFTTKTCIEFTAVQNGNANVELYNVAGAKVRSLFSGNVIEGQVYKITAGDAQLPKGIYVYRINNGKQSQRGQIIKLE